MKPTTKPTKPDAKLVAKARTLTTQVKNAEKSRSDRDDTIAELLTSGCSVSAIAAAIGLDSQLVRRVKTLRQI